MMAQPNLGKSQERQFTLEQCLEYARHHSPASLIAQSQFQVSFYDYKAFRAGLWPSISLNGSAPGLVRSILPVTQDDGTQQFRQQNQAYSQAGLRVTQPIALTGGSVSIGTSLNRFDVFGPSGYALWQSTPVFVSYNQPLFQYNALRWNKKTQPLRYKISEISYLEALEEVAIDITGKFFAVLIQRANLDNAIFNLSINDSIYVISKGRFNVGKYAENDLLQSELAVMNAQTGMELSRLDLLKATQDLAIALGLPMEETITVVPPLDFPEIHIDPDFALQQALSNRSDAANFELKRLEAESQVASARWSNRFSADLNASFGLNQSSANFSGVYQNPLDQQTVNLGFSIPIVQWGRAKALIESSLARQKATEEQIQLERNNLEQNVRIQVLRFTQSQRQVLVAAKADTVAMRRFEVSKNRYLIGKDNITNLQIAQNDKDRGRISFFQTLQNYWVGYYAIRRATLFDFKAGQPIMMPVGQIVK